MINYTTNISVISDTHNYFNKKVTNIFKLVINTSNSISKKTYLEGPSLSQNRAWYINI